MQQLVLVKQKKNKPKAKVTVKVTNKKRKTVKRTSKKVRKNRNSAISAAGVAFQKCTLAPADFGAGTGFSGIPDDYDGDVITKMHTAVVAMPTYTAGNDLYIVQLPIPGIAYFYGNRAAGTTGAITLTAVPYDDSTTLFPTANFAQNVTSFRYASNVLEYINTNNEFTWGGGLEIWKGKVGHGLDPIILGGAPAYTDVGYLEGLGPLINTSKPQSVFPLHDGAYCPSFNTEATYEWTDTQSMTITELNLNQSVAPATDAVCGFATLGFTGFVGLGTFECTVMKFPAIIAAQTGFFRSWACVEYQVSPSSILYDYRHMSPPADFAAIALIKEYHKQIPCAVPFRDNATFWESFKKWVSRASTVLKHVPGPVGMVATGVETLLDIGHGLW